MFSNLFVVFFLVTGTRAMLAGTDPLYGDGFLMVAEVIRCRVLKLSFRGALNNTTAKVQMISQRSFRKQFKAI